MSRYVAIAPSLPGLGEMPQHLVAVPVAPHVNDSFTLDRDDGAAAGLQSAVRAGRSGAPARHDAAARGRGRLDVEMEIWKDTEPLPHGGGGRLAPDQVAPGSLPSRGPLDRACGVEHCRVSSDVVLVPGVEHLADELGVFEFRHVYSPIGRRR